MVTGSRLAAEREEDVALAERRREEGSMNTRLEPPDDTRNPVDLAVLSLFLMAHCMDWGARFVLLPSPPELVLKRKERSRKNNAM